MPTLTQLEDSLRKVGELFHVLPLQGGAQALLTKRGARVLGIFATPDSENWFWTNDAVAEQDRFRAFIRAGDWNLGGERFWIAPEVQYNVQDRSDFWRTLVVPAAMDPGNYDFKVTADVAQWEQTFSLTAYNPARGEVHLRTFRTLSAVSNPLPASEQFDLHYAGYQQTITLTALSDTPILSGAWNLIQLNAGGTLLIPCFGEVQAVPYFGNVPTEARQTIDNVLRIPITGVQKFKVGYPAPGMTGRMGYVQPLPDGRQLLLIRVFFNDPSNPYPEEPPEQPGNNGHSVFVYNDDGRLSPDRRFGEMECAGRTVGSGIREITDTFILYGFVGESTAIARAAMRLLGVKL